MVTADEKELLCAAAMRRGHILAATLLRAGGKSDVNIRYSEKQEWFPSLSAGDKQEWSPLLCAVAIGDEIVAKRLLEAGAYVELDGEGMSLLNIAVRRGYQPMVSLLLASGANPSHQDRSGQASIHVAACEGHEKILPLLLLRGVDVNILTTTFPEGRSPLIIAATRGHSRTVKALLTAGADVKLRDNDQRSALDLAALNGHVDVMRELLHHRADDVVSCGPDGMTSLHLAAQNNRAGAVDVLIEAGADIMSVTLAGRTALHDAASQGHEEVVSLLLLKGAKVNTDTYGFPPLHLAALSARLPAVKALVTAGADVSLRASNMTPLDLATSQGHIHVMRELVQHGADVMSRDPAGNTLLHLAARSKQAGAVGVLVTAGADVDAKGNDRQSSPLHDAAVAGSCDVLLALLRHKAGVDVQDRLGRSPLAWACMNLQEVAADLLLRSGADETSVDKYGNSVYQLVGRWVKEGERQARAEEIDSVRSLLNRAPADRAWRRRGLLILCRTFAYKPRLGVASSQDVNDSIEQKGGVRGMLHHPTSFSTGVSRRAKAIERDKERESAKHIAIVDADGADRDMASIKGAGTEDSGSLYNVEGSVVGLEDDDLFRLIMSFL